MTDHYDPGSGRMPCSAWFLRLPGVLLLVLLTGFCAAADDAYLQMLDEEATKVEGAVTDKEGVGDAASTTSGSGDGERASTSREGFEDLMRDRHVGTYSFYRRLPERSREEIFLDYQGGAEMEALRDKIVDRFLHR